MSKPKRLLITGAGGQLGKILAQKATASYQVSGTYNQHEIQMNHINFIQTDLTQRNMVDILLKMTRPDAIIHLAAAASPDYCQEHSKRSRKINVEASALLAQKAAERSIPFFFTSTDLVFNGRMANSNEQTKPEPICIYGEQKLEAEQAIMARNPHATIFRLANLIGPFGFFQKMLQNLSVGKELCLFTDEIRSFISAEDAADFILDSLEAERQGLWHLGGTEALSRFRLGKIICETLALDANCLIPMKQYLAMGEFSAPRPRDVSLDCSRLLETGFRPRTIEQFLRDTYQK